MPSWGEFAAAEPALAATVRATFGVRKHATLATLRLDGAPRISGTEVVFGDDGQLVLAMMPGSRKAADLRRDPRLALHSPTVDTPAEDPASWLGDGRIAGFAVELDDAAAQRFRFDVREVVHTAVGTPPDHLVITAWHDGQIRRFERR